MGLMVVPTRVVATRVSPLMKLDNYIGYTCDGCGYSWEQDFRLMPTGVLCPECGVPQSEPDVQIVVSDTDVEDGVYECYACGHTFIYQATVNANSDDTPNCTNCTSSNVGKIY